MQIELEPRGRRVVVFGDQRDTRQAVRRFRAAGAQLTVVSECAPDPETEPAGVRHAVLPAVDDTSGLLRLLGPAWLVVHIGLPEPMVERIADLAAHLHLLVMSESPAPRHGQVVLVGGGPGRTRLLTLEAVDALREADVVFYDRLAPTDELAALARGAELIDVGKSPYHHPVDQRSIEEQMIDRARAGDAVVRLKGGDPFVFGRGGEEMQACVAAGVPVRVVPGVSSSVAVPAAANIPVTHRGLSRAYTVISGHVPLDQHELDGLVRLGGTIVILMGVANLTQIVAGLCRSGLDPATPAAVIERGYSPDQRSAFTTAGQLPAEVRRLDIESPAVIVIGDVVAVAPEFAASAEAVAASAHRPSTLRARAS